MKSNHMRWTKYYLSWKGWLGRLQSELCRLLFQGIFTTSNNTRRWWNSAFLYWQSTWLRLRKWTRPIFMFVWPRNWTVHKTFSDFHFWFYRVLKQHVLHFTICWVFELQIKIFLKNWDLFEEKVRGYLLHSARVHKWTKQKTWGAKSCTESRGVLDIKMKMGSHVFVPKI